MWQKAVGSQIFSFCMQALVLCKSGLFFGHLEKNSSPKKLKTQAKSRKNSSKISNKLKNRQLDLSSIAGQESKPLIFFGRLGSERFGYY